MSLISFFRRSPNALFYVIGLATFGFFVIMLVWGDDGLAHLVDLQRQKNQIAVQNAKLALESVELLNQIQVLASPQALEQAARTELGLVRSSETVYVIEAK
jgi:cell division protein FtsB